jgi:hypothetical protein
MHAAKLCLTILILASLPTAFAAESPVPHATPQRSTREGLQLLHQMQEVLGGAKRIAAIRDFDETIRAEAWDERGGPLGEVRKRTRWIRTPSARVETRPRARRRRDDET